MGSHSPVREQTQIKFLPMLVVRIIIDVFVEVLGEGKLAQFLENKEILPKEIMFKLRLKDGRKLKVE